MYELIVERTFRAAHAIEIRGERETPHEHDWHVVVVVEADGLDHDGLVCDFHELEARLDAVIAPLAGADLGATAAFAGVNPTAEHVARHVADAMRAALPDGVRLQRATVTEAPGCRASYRPATGATPTQSPAAPSRDRA